MQCPEDSGPKAGMGTLVCFALKEEAGPFQKMATGRGDIAILVTGIGRKNTEKKMREFLEKNSPKRVLTCGIAGALNPRITLGEVLYHSDDPELVKLLAAAGAKAAKFYCADRIAATAVEKKKLRAQTGADVVEMESDVVHVICRERGIPCATVRAISDAADEDMPLDFNLLSNADQSLNFGKLAWAIAKSPSKIPALMRLQKQTQFAAGRLAEVLMKLLAD